MVALRGSFRELGTIITLWELPVAAGAIPKHKKTFLRPQKLTTQLLSVPAVQKVLGVAVLAEQAAQLLLSDILRPVASEGKVGLAEPVVLAAVPLLGLAV